MTLNTQEHEDILSAFEREFQVMGEYARKEPKALWKIGHIYCHGETNIQFLAYRRGYALGRSVYLQTA